MARVVQRHVGSCECELGAGFFFHACFIVGPREYQSHLSPLSLFLHFLNLIGTLIIKIEISYFTTPMIGYAKCPKLMPAKISIVEPNSLKTKRRTARWFLEPNSLIWSAVEEGRGRKRFKFKFERVTGHSVIEEKKKLRKATLLAGGKTLVVIAWVEICVSRRIRDNGDPPRDNTNIMKRLSVWFQSWPLAVLILMDVQGRCSSCLFLYLTFYLSRWCRNWFTPGPNLQVPPAPPCLMRKISCDLPPHTLSYLNLTPFIYFPFYLANHNIINSFITFITSHMLIP